MNVFAYFDVLVIVVAAPILLLIGVPASGYAIGAGVWIAVRALSVPIERAAGRTDFNRANAIKVGLMLARLFALALAVIIARNVGGKNAGITALVIVVFGFTVSLFTSAFTRPGSR
jgi:hypothetical protein